LKIAFIVNSFPILSETFILNQITGLLDLGHKVDIYSRFSPSQIKVHPDVENYKLHFFTHYLDKLPKNKAKRILNALILFATNFHKNPIAVFNSTNIFKFGKEAFSLYLFYIIIPFLGKNYDIIHCHFGPSGNLGVLLKSVGIKGKLVVSFHAYDLTKLLVTKGNYFYSKLFQRADLLMPISNHWEIKLKELGCPSNKIIVHHMGVNTNIFKFVVRKPYDINIINILSVGRLVEKKGFEFGIRAVALIKRKYPKVKLKYCIVGNGMLRNHLSTLIKKLELFDIVEILESKTQNEVKELMIHSHIFLLPSITAQDGDQEGIPVVLMEAMATGLPVISSLHTGIPELVQDGQSGFLVPERNVDAMKKKLEYLINHPEICPEMGRAGRKFVEEHYDIKKQNKKLVKIYEELLNEREHL